jgi:hypothetical protein
LAEARDEIMEKNNSRTGSNFDDFLKDEGIYDEVTAKALKRAILERLNEGMEAIPCTNRNGYG